MSLLNFLEAEKEEQKIETSLSLKDSFIHPYWFLGHCIGFHDSDFKVFKLVRNRDNFQTKTYPEHTQISRSIILNLIFNKKTMKIVIEIDGKIRYQTTPRTWLNLGVVDRLTPDQEDQLFLHKKYLHEVRA